MKTITVDKEKLEALIAKKCFYYQETNGKVPMCKKQRPNECHLDFIEKIEIECPYDCPHRDEYKWKRCTLGKCGMVKKTLKELEHE